MRGRGQVNLHRVGSWALTVDVLEVSKLSLQAELLTRSGLRSPEDGHTNQAEPAGEGATLGDGQIKSDGRNSWRIANQRIHNASKRANESGSANNRYFHRVRALGRANRILSNRYAAAVRSESIRIHWRCFERIHKLGLCRGRR